MSKSTQMTLNGETAKPYANKQQLQTLFVEEDKSAAEIASQFDCGISTVRMYLRTFGIDRDDSPGESVSFYTDTDGYEYLRVDEHYIPFHRALMVALHGLEVLEGDSVVHHCSRVTWDNRPSQLRTFPTQSAHTRHHERPSIMDDQQTLDTYPSIEGLSDGAREHRKQQSQQTTLTSFL